MGKLIAVATALVLASAGVAWGGVAPNSGAQSMSGAKIKAPSSDQGTDSTQKDAPGGEKH